MTEPRDTTLTRSPKERNEKEKKEVIIDVRRENRVVRVKCMREEQWPSSGRRMLPRAY